MRFPPLLNLMLDSSLNFLENESCSERRSDFKSTILWSRQFRDKLYVSIRSCRGSCAGLIEGWEGGGAGFETHCLVCVPVPILYL